MKTIELQALRRLLFFSASEAAQLIGGVSEQAWRRWESGTRKVPDDIAQTMMSLMSWRNQAISASLETIRDAPEETKISLTWYDSLDDWATLPDREQILWRPQQSVCAELLTRHPQRLNLIIFDTVRYSTWLAGRTDGELMRSQWVASLID